MKHAYLILVHNDFEILGQLIRAIDDERNDIYIHFDRKVAHCPDCRTLHAGLMVLTERIDVRWGDVSVVRAEYALFDAAYRRQRQSCTERIRSLCLYVGNAASHTEMSPLEPRTFPTD